VFGFAKGNQNRSNQKQYHILLVGKNQKSARETLLIWLYPAGVVTVIPIDQTKVTIPRIEIGKGWQNLSITKEL
jgi:hypothetical protein